MKTIFTAFARNRVFANILFLLIFFVGALAVLSMNRENFPEMDLDMITIVVPYPGADPEEVEEGISQKIEEAIESLEGIRLYTTDSNEGSSFTLIEVKESFDLDKVLDKVRNKIDSISTFPLAAEKPVITEMTVKDPVIMLYLSGGMDERRLKEWAEQIKDELARIPQLSQIGLFGVRDYEIAIEVSEQRLREYGLSLQQVADALRRSNLNLTGGTVRTRGEEIRIRTMGRKYSGKELAKIVVLARPGGELITLERLAVIRDDFTEDPIQASINGETSVLLWVFKTPEEDALAIARAVTDFVHAKRHQLPDGANLKILYDNTEMLRSRISLLTRNGLIGLSLVFFLLWLFLDGRLSFWAGMGIPISISGALGVLWALGGTINMISLFAFIMVLGIVVDDAIVVGESIFTHRRRGDAPLMAAVNGISEVGLPVVAAVTTSIVAFLPLAFIGGIMGKFIVIMPQVVIACLLISLVECLFLLPAHLNDLPTPQSSVGGRGFADRIHRTTRDGLEWVVRRIYTPLLNQALKWRYIAFSIALAVLLITIGTLRGGLLKFTVMPEVDGFVMTATVEFPNGTPAAVTRKAIQRMEATLLELNAETDTASGEPMLKDRLILVGQSLQEIPLMGPHVGSVQAILLESEKRGVHFKDLMVRWETAIGTLPGVKSLIFEGMAMGPPGAPIEIWVQGREMPEILAAADQLQQRLRKFKGVYQIRSDFSPGKNEMRLELKPEARTLGLTVEDLARQVYAGYYGEEALRLQRGRDDVRVKVRYTADERSRLSDLEQVRIITPGGQRVPLLSVARVEYAPGYATITRTNGMRRVAVSADVDAGKANANEILAELSASYFAELTAQHPGLFISVQGEQKKMRESFSSLAVGFPLAVLGIFIIMATIFRSYAQPFIILFTVPFGIIGAVIGHFMLGYDLSLISVFGMVALTGVVVNDAIVLIERINANLAEGLPFREAIRRGGARRFRAIFLTTVSTVLGLSPLIMETDLQARFLVPMAISLAAGVAFATILTLVLIPSLLVIFNDLRCLSYRLRRGAWPQPEQVEPASRRFDTIGQIAPHPETEPHRPPVATP